MDTLTTLAAARHGDSKAFEALVTPWKHGLSGFCFRMLGAHADAEDAVQETLLRSWRNLGAFEGRAQFRTWLYQIATRVCLDLIDKRKARSWPTIVHGAAGPTSIPAPDALYEYVDPAPGSFEENVAIGPDAIIEQRESVALALLVSLQSLPGTQRAVLVLRDVMGLQASEVAELLEVSVAAANSTLQRARENVSKFNEKGLAPKPPNDAEERSLLAKYLHSWTTSDASALLTLLKQDAMMSMPPMGEWYQGAQVISGFLGVGVFSNGADPQRFCGVSVRLAGHEGVAIYMRTAPGQPYTANSVHLLETSDGQISHVRVWVTPAIFKVLGLETELVNA